jgi:hypothetical protein
MKLVLAAEERILPDPQITTPERHRRESWANRRDGG